MIRWLINNTPLSGKEISSYLYSYYDIKVNYETVSHIKRGVSYSHVPGMINIDSPNLQKYIALCYPANFSEGIERCIIGSGPKNYYNTSFLNDGEINQYKLDCYNNAKKNSMV
jgi:hypothetical protein